jgi:hypothetical protein
MNTFVLHCLQFHDVGVGSELPDGTCIVPHRISEQYILIWLCLIIIIIIIFIYCKWVVTWWQRLLYTYFLTLIINLLREGHIRSM